MEHLWNSYYVQMRITYREHSRDGKVKTYTDTFECDQHIAEAIRLFNEKGYATGNCCEGHPLPHHSGQQPAQVQKYGIFRGRLYFIL